MYGIICNARKGGSLGVRTLALVDRARSKRLWWTSDNTNIAICYEKKEAAEFAAKRLRRNNVRVVPFVRVQQILSEQLDFIKRTEKARFFEAMRAEGEGPGWDAHKDLR